MRLVLDYIVKDDRIIPLRTPRECQQYAVIAEQNDQLAEERGYEPDKPLGTLPLPAMAAKTDANTARKEVATDLALREIYMAEIKSLVYDVRNPTCDDQETVWEKFRDPRSGDLRLDLILAGKYARELLQPTLASGEAEHAADLRIQRALESELYWLVFPDIDRERSFLLSRSSSVSS